jgi:hypothetical protein
MDSADHRLPIPGQADEGGSHQTIAFGIFTVDSIDRIHHAVDGLAGELVAEDVEADPPVVGGVGLWRG